MRYLFNEDIMKHYFLIVLFFILAFAVSSQKNSDFSVETPFATSYFVLGPRVGVCTIF